MRLSLNVSEVLRNIGRFKVRIGREVAEVVADNLWEEFNTLVMETPQWTGTAAASWRIGFGMSASEGGYTKMQKRTREEALQKGHMEAVSEAEMRSYGAIEEYKDKGYQYGDLVIYNNAPSIEFAESGLNLRSVNEPGGMFERFERRMNGKSMKLYRDIRI